MIAALAALVIASAPSPYPVQDYLDRYSDEPGFMVAIMADVIKEECAEAGVKPEWALAVMGVESNYDPDAVSITGVRGLMQVTPGTAKTVSSWLGVDLDPRDVLDNIKLGIHYLGAMKKLFGSIQLAIVAYNKGPKYVSAMWASSGFSKLKQDDYLNLVLRRRKTIDMFREKR